MTIDPNRLDAIEHALATAADIATIIHIRRDVMAELAELTADNPEGHGAQMARCRAMRRARELQRDCELKVGELLLAMRAQTIPPLAALGLHWVTAKQWERRALKARSANSKSR